jgi:hypothetical protein
MQSWDYETITAAALQTLTAIATEARHAGVETAEPRWAMAAGVLRGWSDLVGAAAREDDRAMMEQLFEGMPLPQEPTPGQEQGWHFSSVLVLRKPCP